MNVHLPPWPGGTWTRQEPAGAANTSGAGSPIQGVTPNDSLAATQPPANSGRATIFFIPCRIAPIMHALAFATFRGGALGVTSALN